MIKRMMRWLERRLRPADYYEQEALVSLGLDALLLGGYDHAFISMCRQIRSGVRQELYRCGFARMVQEGRVDEARTVDLLSNTGWSNCVFWLKSFLNHTPMPD